MVNPDAGQPQALRDAVNSVFGASAPGHAASITVDILRTNNSFPALSIVGSGNAPTLSSQQFNEVAVSGVDIDGVSCSRLMGFDITGSPPSITKLHICLSCTGWERTFLI